MIKLVLVQVVCLWHISGMIIKVELSPKQKKLFKDWCKEHGYTMAGYLRLKIKEALK